MKYNQERTGTSTRATVFRNEKEWGNPYRARKAKAKMQEWKPGGIADWI